MAVLAFISVLIILFLVLIVMVHMRNRKLKSILEEQMAERQLLDKMSADSFEILHLSAGTNVKEMNLKEQLSRKERITYHYRSKPNPNQHQPGKDIVLGKNCWIGMNSTVLPGVVLGDHTVVGAGSVVTKSVSVRPWKCSRRQTTVC